MNGFLWLSERNVLTNVIPSPIHGLEDIVNNQVYNVTYLNPAKHKHIPRPPAGVVIPPKVLGPLDNKPFPVLWHEDNSGRRQNGRERLLSVFVESLEIVFPCCFCLETLLSFLSPSKCSACNLAGHQYLEQWSVQWWEKQLIVLSRVH
ncbi:5'-3' exoribonuclease 4-like isoform X2 [Syzygium oleosum]|uniref:5'-3' exoribonuclease 4-like isoform X2 n=1 Tax=Syzygium oleosum TaxID=219896 RepID=UPI0024BBBC86|nr:5'-3' exoribonuclease 4-like isoform X2 [Syzygium oleosum]